MAAFTVEERKGVFYLAGFVNENVDLSEVSATGGEPLRLNFEGVAGFSKAGAEHFQSFLAGLKGSPVELHECQRFMLDLLAPYGKQVVSCYLPCRCKTCNIAVETLVKTKDVRIEAGAVHLPKQRCHQCRELLEPVVDTRAYFSFLNA